MDSKSVSEKDDSHKEEIAHMEEFNGALKELLGKSFVSLDEALKGLELFKLAGFSPLSKHSLVTLKGNGRSLCVYRCEQHQSCSFRLLLHHPFGDRKDYWFTLGQKQVSEHSGHELKKPARATHVLLDLAMDSMKSVALDGSSGMELQKKTLNAVSKVLGGEDALNEETFNYLRRKLEKEKLSRRGKDVPESFEVMIRNGEELVSVDSGSCSSDLLAILGLLLKTQRKLPDAYINVSFNKHLSYVFFALPEQRRKGSLFGDLRLFDDKHGVSQNGYHLACCTVQGNQSLDCVACALIDSSNGTNWSLFVEDCVKAFETTTNAPKRKWNIAIADGDGCIYSAVKAEDPEVQLWSCWEHFDRNIRSKYLRLSNEWSALHVVLYKMLSSDSVKQMGILEQEARNLLKAITNDELKEKEEAMFNEVLGRKLASLKVFSNGWNSQSGAENTNSIWQKLGVGPANSLAVVFDKLLAFFEREEVRDKERHNSKSNLSPVVASLADQLSQKAFRMVLVQFNDGLNYEMEDISPNDQPQTTFNVTRIGLKDGQDANPRIVRKNGNGWSCSCTMPVYVGIPCRHISCVMVKLQQKIPKECVHSRWWRNDLQPEVHLKNQSPFLSKPGVAPNSVDNEIEEGVAFEENIVENFEVDKMVDFVDYVADNGGEFGDDSIMESADVVVLNNKGKSLDEITPKERRNELTNYFYQLVQRIGYGKGSMDAMDDLEKLLIDWEEKNLKETKGLGLAKSIKTVGKPSEHALKPANHKPRSNGTKIKKTYRCGVCGKVGHTAGSKCPEKCFNCPAGTKNHKKGQCLSGKRNRDESEVLVDGKISNEKKKLNEDGNTMSTSLSNKGKSSCYFYFDTLSLTF